MKRPSPFLIRCATLTLACSVRAGVLIEPDLATSEPPQQAEENAFLMKLQIPGDLYHPENIVLGIQQYSPMKRNVLLFLDNQNTTRTSAPELNEAATPEHLVRMALRAEQRGDFEEAAVNAWQAARTMPSTEYVMLLARILLKCGDTRNGRSLLLKIHDLDPKLPETAYLIGESFYTDGDTKRAAEWYERAAENSPEYAEILQQKLDSIYRSTKP